MATFTGKFGLPGAKTVVEELTGKKIRGNKKTDKKKTDKEKTDKKSSKPTGPPSSTKNRYEEANKFGGNTKPVTNPEAKSSDKFPPDDWVEKEGGGFNLSKEAKKKMGGSLDSQPKQKQNRFNVTEALEKAIKPSQAMSMMPSVGRGDVTQGKGGSQPVEQGRQQASHAIDKLREKAKQRYESALEHQQSLGSDASNQELLTAMGDTHTAKSAYLDLTGQRGQLAREAMSERSSMAREHAAAQGRMGATSLRGQYNTATAGVRGAMGIQEQQMRGRQASERLATEMDVEQQEGAMDRYVKIKQLLQDQNKGITNENLMNLVTESAKNVRDRGGMLSAEDMERELTKDLIPKLKTYERLTGFDTGVSRLSDPAGIGTGQNKNQNR